MSAKIVYFPVGNGDMTLIVTEDGKRVLIDAYIRAGEEYPDVINMLRNDYLTRDSKGRLFVDLFIWSHPDKDHCGGMNDHFHLGKPDEWSEKNDKIFINNIWSSPIVFRRSSKNNSLTSDAIALNKEVKRRVKLYRDNKKIGEDGDLVTILGEDENGKTDDILGIVCKLDDCLSVSPYMKGRLLGPSPRSEQEERESNLGKNHSSVIFNFEITGDSKKVNYLCGGDAEVLCWEMLEERLTENNNMSWVSYDILLAPHHCSWHTLSNDSLSKKKEKGEEAVTSESAMKIFNSAKQNAKIISSSNVIEDNDVDPPAYRAMKEYENILDDKSGQFLCVAEHKNSDDENVPLEIKIEGSGLKIVPVARSMKESGESAVNRRGGGGYA